MNKKLELEFLVGTHIYPYYCEFWTSRSHKPFYLQKFVDFTGRVVDEEPTEDATVYLYFKVKLHHFGLSKVYGRLECYGSDFSTKIIKSRDDKLTKKFKSALPKYNRLINSVFDDGFYGGHW